MPFYKRGTPGKSKCPQFPENQQKSHFRAFEDPLPLDVDIYIFNATMQNSEKNSSALFHEFSCIGSFRGLLLYPGYKFISRI